jgi:hypothetical protein
MQNMLEKFKEDKARQKEIEAEIGRKRQLAMGSQTNPSVEGSCSNPSVNVRDPFWYVPPIHENQPQKRKNIQSFFSPSSTPTNASSMSQPTLDNHWKKQYKESTFEYIARWWYDADIPFNACPLTLLPTYVGFHCCCW